MDSEDNLGMTEEVGQLDQGEANPEPATTKDISRVDSETCFSLSADANNVRFLTPAQCRHEAIGMKSEELADYVTKSGWGDVLRKLVQVKPYIGVLWSRFDELKTGQMIAGCLTKEEFSLKCLNRSIRAVQYMLYGRTPAKPKANNVRPDNPGTTADADEPSEDDPSEDSEVWQAGRDIKTGQELLAAHTTDMLRVLTGKSIANDAMRVKRAAGMVKDLRQAIDEGKLFGTEPIASPTTPQHSAVADPLPEPDSGSMEELRQLISAMADTGEIEQALNNYLRTLVLPVLAHHPYKPSLNLTIAVSYSAEPTQKKVPRKAVASVKETGALLVAGSGK